LRDARIREIAAEYRANRRVVPVPEPLEEEWVRSVGRPRLIDYEECADLYTQGWLIDALAERYKVTSIGVHLALQKWAAA
jgi:hypothetical protein